MNKITFITGNEKKSKYLSDFFGMEVDHLKLDLPEIQSLDLREVVEDKVRRAYEAVKAPVLVEDVSLKFSALGDLPGPLIKWFLKSLGNEKICDMLDKLGNREAIAEVNYAYCDKNGVVVFPGLVRGKISETPRGGEGFGFDPIFIPDGYTKNWAEMTPQEKHDTAMRKEPLEKLKLFFRI